MVMDRSTAGPTVEVAERKEEGLNQEHDLDKTGLTHRPDLASQRNPLNPSGVHLRYTTVIRARKSMRLLRCRRIASVSCRAAACSMPSPIVLIASNP
jgi:hypothetical protein